MEPSAQRIFINPVAQKPIVDMVKIVELFLAIKKHVKYIATVILTVQKGTIASIVLKDNGVYGILTPVLRKPNSYLFV